MLARHEHSKRALIVVVDAADQRAPITIRDLTLAPHRLAVEVAKDGQLHVVQLALLTLAHSHTYIHTACQAQAPWFRPQAGRCYGLRYAKWYGVTYTCA